jgi:hypothetical protein
VLNLNRAELLLAMLSLVVPIEKSNVIFQKVNQLSLLGKRTECNCDLAEFFAFGQQPEAATFAGILPSTPDFTSMSSLLCCE